MGVGKQLCQIGTQSIGAPLPRSGEKRDDVDGHRAVGGSEELQAAFGSVSMCGNRCRQFCPVGRIDLTDEGSFTDSLSLLVDQSGHEMVVEGFAALDPKRERVSRAIAQRHAPVSVVDDTLRRGSGRSLDRYSQSMTLRLVEQPGTGQTHGGSVDRLPAFRAVLKRAVLHKLGIESTLTGMVDFLKEKAILIRTG